MLGYKRVNLPIIGKKQKKKNKKKLKDFQNI